MDMIKKDVCTMMAYLHMHGPGSLAHADTTCNVKGVLVWRRCVLDMILREESPLRTLFDQYLRQGSNGLRYEFDMIDPLDELMQHYHSTYTIMQKTQNHVGCSYDMHVAKPNIPYTQSMLRTLPSVDEHCEQIDACQTMRRTNDPMYFSTYDSVVGNTKRLMINKRPILNENKHAKKYSTACKRAYIATLNT